MLFLDKTLGTAISLVMYDHSILLVHVLLLMVVWSTRTKIRKKLMFQKDIHHKLLSS